MSVLPLYTVGSSNLVVDNLATGVLVLDDKLHVSFINPAAEVILGVSARQVRRLPLDETMLCPDQMLLEHMRSALENRQPVTERGIELVPHDRSRVTVDCTIIPLLRNQRAIGLLIEIQHIDRHLRISREERLISQQAMTREVVRGLAHEIKNPLGGLRGAAQLLAGELQDPELQEYTRVIIDEADRLRNLVNRMLGPTRPPARANVNLHLALERVRSLVQAEVGERVRIVRDYDPSIPELQADADQLIQALLNITRNAAKALKGEGEIQLRTRIQRQMTLGNRFHKLVAQIDVEDNGPGVPDALREHLFYPMVTGDANGGSGLGLSIAQSLINGHQGLIEYQSEPGRTVFTVYLPLEIQDD